VRCGSHTQVNPGVRTGRRTYRVEGAVLFEAVLQERGLLLGQPQFLPRAPVVVVLGAGPQGRRGRRPLGRLRLLDALPFDAAADHRQRRHAVRAAAGRRRRRLVRHAQRERRLQRARRLPARAAARGAVVRRLRRRSAAAEGQAQRQAGVAQVDVLLSHRRRERGLVLARQLLRPLQFALELRRQSCLYTCATSCYLQSASTNGERGVEGGWRKQGMSEGKGMKWLARIFEEGGERGQGPIHACALTLANV
jgi:hypothetical protein